MNKSEKTEAQRAAVATALDKAAAAAALCRETRDDVKHAQELVGAGASARALSIAATHIETAELWLAVAERDL